MTLDNYNLGIANYSISNSKLLLMFRTSNPLLLVPKIYCLQQLQLQCDKVLACELEVVFISFRIKCFDILILSTK